MKCFNRLSVNVSKSESIGWLMLVSSSEASWAAGFRKHERSSDRISITSWHNCLWGRPILSGHWRSQLSYIYITRVLSAWWLYQMRWNILNSQGDIWTKALLRSSINSILATFAVLHRHPSWFPLALTSNARWPGRTPPIASQLLVLFGADDSASSATAASASSHDDGFYDERVPDRWDIRELSKTSWNKMMPYWSAWGTRCLFTTVPITSPATTEEYQGYYPSRHDCCTRLLDD